MTVPLWRKREPGLSIPPLKALQGSFIRHFHFSSNIISFNNIMSSTMSVNTFSSADHSTLLSTSHFLLSASLLTITSIFQILVISSFSMQSIFSLFKSWLHVNANWLQTVCDGPASQTVCKMPTYFHKGWLIPQCWTVLLVMSLLEQPDSVLYYSHGMKSCDCRNKEKKN